MLIILLELSVISLCMHMGFVRLSECLIIIIADVIMFSLHGECITTLGEMFILCYVAPTSGTIVLSPVTSNTSEGGRIHLNPVPILFSA